MTEQPGKKQLRAIDEPFVAAGPSGVALRGRLKNLTPGDEEVLRAVGAHLGHLASGDLRRRCADGNGHGSDTWAARKQGLTAGSSSRWAGSITKATHDQWALSRRCQAAYIQNLEAGIRTLSHRLSRPVGEKGSKRAPGGYRSKGEWFQKSRRLAALGDRLAREKSDRETGTVHVVRGGRRLLITRHNLQAAQLTETEWRQRWEASRWFLAADGESGKRYGNETIHVTPDGEVFISSRLRSRTWPARGTAGTSCHPGSLSRTGARSGGTAPRRTRRSPTASTTTRNAGAGTSPRPGSAPRSGLFRWRRHGPGA